jgi:phosphoglycolate/pyridoxal phosphate phosphatase family enzyme
VALDLDGVVYRGDMVLPGAREALEDVLARSLDLRYVSNNSTAHREEVSSRLRNMGLPAGAQRVFTSGYVAAQWLRGRFPEGTNVMVMGEEGLLREMREAGFDAHHVGEKGQTAEGSAADPSASGPDGADPEGFGSRYLGQPAAVVVGMDRSISFRTLARAQAAIRSGALFVATNPDPTFPTPHGLVPGAGAMVAAVATAAEAQPVFMGKPALALADVLASVTGISAAQTLFVGDRLSTDIAMGQKAGMTTTLVLTGVTSETDLESARAEGDLVPDHVLADLRELPGLLDSLGL